MFLQRHPDVVTLREIGGFVEVCYDRTRLTMIEQQVSAWERGLKHAGLCLYSGGKGVPKVWRVANSMPEVFPVAERDLCLDIEILASWQRS